MKSTKYLLLLLSVIALLSNCDDKEESIVEPDPESEIEMIDLGAIDPNLPSFVSVEKEATTPEGMKWEKVERLSDEFDVWDSNKWFKPLWNYGIPVQMRDKNSGIENGNLWIKATLDEGEERWFETSRVQSKTRISYPMYTESRIKTAHISAYNTFWLNQGENGGNSRNEIDVIENNSKPTCECQPDFPWQMNSQYFHVIDGDTKRAKGNYDNRKLSEENPMRGVPWNEDYHIVGVWWKNATDIQFYLDGEPAGSVVSERYFTRNLNIIWDLWTIDANWSGGIATQQDLLDDEINKMKIDWVRTWQLVEK
ncbi:MAG: beta-agarase [Bacteroidota bacterium]